MTLGRKSRRLILALTIIWALITALLFGVTLANAAYPDSWIPAARRPSVTRGKVAREEYGYARTQAYCRPQFINRQAKSDERWHRWSCATWDPTTLGCDSSDRESVVTATFVILGSRYRGMFNWRPHTRPSASEGPSHDRVPRRRAASART